jgi:hypothetical protein
VMDDRRFNSLAKSYLVPSKSCAFGFLWERSGLVDRGGAAI